MQVAEVLVVLEVEQVVGLAADGHLIFGDLYDCVVGRPLNYGQTQVPVC